MQISATIVTLNEERNIARAIESLRCADEVLVVDSGSTDRTREIAARLGARVIEEPWRGYARAEELRGRSARRTIGFSRSTPTNRLRAELAAEILALKKNGRAVRRLFVSAPGAVSRALDSPQRLVSGPQDPALRSRARPNGSANYVHESVRVNGTVGELQGDLLHFTCDSLSEHLRTLDRYTSLAARELVAQGKAVPMRRLAVDPAWTFFRTYVLQRGFLDGPQGLAIAWMAALYTFLEVREGL